MQQSDRKYITIGSQSKTCPFCCTEMKLYKESKEEVGLFIMITYMCPNDECGFMAMFNEELFL